MVKSQTSGVYPTRRKAGDKQCRVIAKERDDDVCTGTQQDWGMKQVDEEDEQK